MHKSIPLLRDLTPSSEDTIDPCTQLSPLHRPRPGQTKQHFIVSYSEIPIIISPPDAWAAPGHHVLFLRTEAGKGVRLENRGQELCPNPASHSCWVRGLQPQPGQRSGSSSGEEQEISNVQKQAHTYEGHV